MVGQLLALGTLEVGDPEGNPGGIKWMTDSCCYCGFEIPNYSSVPRYSPSILAASRIVLFAFGIAEADRVLPRLGEVDARRHAGALIAKWQGSRAVPQSTGRWWNQARSDAPALAQVR